MAVRFLPARTIGGDLYDFLEYGPNRTAIVLGDVSGKAAPAALFAALVSGIMRAAAAQQPEPAAMLALLNDALQERKLDSQYVTMLFALWNDENQTLQVANSGAVQPVFCRAGQSLPVRAEGFPLGMFPDVTYDEFSVSTQPGDAIVFVSDGILDAENEKEEMYGEERLAEIALRQPRNACLRKSPKPSSPTSRASRAQKIASTTKPSSSFASVDFLCPIFARRNNCHPERTSAAAADDGSRRTCFCLLRSALATNERLPHPGCHPERPDDERSESGGSRRTCFCFFRSALATNEGCPMPKRALCA